MKKLINAFLTVGFVLSIVFIVLGIALIPLSFVNDPVDGAQIGRGIYFIIAGTFNLVGLIIIHKKWDKEKLTKLAVWSIVLGAILTGFPIVSGILMLVLPEDQYGKAE